MIANGNEETRKMWDSKKKEVEEWTHVPVLFLSVWVARME